MFDLIALGELLIDFTPAGVSETGHQLFETNPGGAPANVLAALAKLGKETAFMGMVGNDQFGIFLQGVLQKSNIDVSNLKFHSKVHTTLAFVHLDQGGERSFSFYRDPGADLMLNSSDLNFGFIKQAKVFHFGSISLTDEPARSATLAAVKFAKENGLIVSFDPNYRPGLWNSKEQAKFNIETGLRFTNILKLSESELELLTGTTDLIKGSAFLYRHGIRLLFVTLGSAGCFYRYPGGTGYVETYKVNAIDTTGAGDAFMAGVLYHLSQLTLEQICQLTQAELEAIITFGNAMGALTTTKRGAIPAFPSRVEIDCCLNQVLKIKAT